MLERQISDTNTTDIYESLTKWVFSLSHSNLQDNDHLIKFKNAKYYYNTKKNNLKQSQMFMKQYSESSKNKLSGVP